MKRIRFFAVATIFVITLTASAQKRSNESDAAAKVQSSQPARAPNVEDHLRILAERLDLTAAQQEKVRPIIQNMFDERQKLMNDQSLSSQQRQVKGRALHEKADREARRFLNADQKKKLDELEAQHPMESAGHVNH